MNNQLDMKPEYTTTSAVYRLCRWHSVHDAGWVKFPGNCGGFSRVCNMRKLEVSIGKSVVMMFKRMEYYIIYFVNCLNKQGCSAVLNITHLLLTVYRGSYRVQLQSSVNFIL